MEARSPPCTGRIHTDQYVNFASYLPKHQKLGVVRTFMNRCETITAEKEEMEHLRGAVRVCGYTSWAVKKVIDNTKTTGVKWLSHMWSLGKSTPSNKE